MDIKKANSLYDDGLTKELYQSGFLSVKFFLYREIYLWIDAQVHSRGITKNQAVLEAQIKFDREENTIWRALRSFAND